jgi:hypothetical protein
MFPDMARLREGFMTIGIIGMTAFGVVGCGGGDDDNQGAAAKPVTAAQPASAAQPAATSSAPSTTTAAPSTVPASDPVAQAAALQGSKPGGVDVKLKGTVRTSATTIRLSGKGTINRRTTAGTFSLRTGPLGQQIAIREVLDGKYLYLTTKLFTHKLQGKRSWMKIDLREAAKSKRFDLGALGSNGPSQDPTQVLNYLYGAGASKKVGTAKINGTQTTHYSADIDLARAGAAVTSEDAKNAIAQLGKMMGNATTPIPVDVWIDSHHRVLRQRVRYTATLGGSPSKLDFTTDFTPTDAPAKVSTPAAKDTVDGLALLGGGTQQTS